MKFRLVELTKVRGIAQIPLIVGLLLMAIAIPVATRLSQQEQDTRQLATTNCSQFTYMTNCVQYSDCEWINNRCQNKVLPTPTYPLRYFCSVGSGTCYSQRTPGGYSTYDYCASECQTPSSTPRPEPTATPRPANTATPRPVATNTPVVGGCSGTCYTAGATNGCVDSTHYCGCPYPNAQWTSTGCPVGRVCVSGSCVVPGATATPVPTACTGSVGGTSYTIDYNTSKCVGSYRCTCASRTGGVASCTNCSYGCNPTTIACRPAPTATVLKWSKVSCSSTTGNWNCSQTAYGTFDTESACQQSSGCDIPTRIPTSTPFGGGLPTPAPYAPVSSINDNFFNSLFSFRLVKIVNAQGSWASLQAIQKACETRVQTTDNNLCNYFHLGFNAYRSWECSNLDNLCGSYTGGSPTPSVLPTPASCTPNGTSCGGLLQPSCSTCCSFSGVGDAWNTLKCCAKDGDIVAEVNYCCSGAYTRIDNYRWKCGSGGTPTPIVTGDCSQITSITSCQWMSSAWDCEWRDNKCQVRSASQYCCVPNNGDPAVVRSGSCRSNEWTYGISYCTGLVTSTPIPTSVCGGQGQACCSGGVCSRSTLNCINSKCCVVDGQNVTNGANCCNKSVLIYENGANKLYQCYSGIVPTPVPNCGNVGQSCCSGSVCNYDNTSCINNKCCIQTGHRADNPTLCCSGMIDNLGNCKENYLTPTAKPTIPYNPGATSIPNITPQPTTQVTPVPTSTNAPPPGPTNPPTPPTNCSYDSLQARVQPDTTVDWNTQLTLAGGEKVNLGCMADGSGQLAENVMIVAEHSSGAQNEFNQNLVDQWTPPRPGNYTVWCESTDTNCAGLVSSTNATLSVGSACKECPNDFHCYGPDNPEWGYAWFATDYVQEGWVTQVPDNYCWDFGINKPQWLGKGMGDANCDGVLDIADTAVWRYEYADISKGDEIVRDNWEADFTGPGGVCDGIVDIGDVSLWRANFTRYFTNY